MENPVFSLNTEIDRDGKVEVAMLGNIKGYAIPCIAYIVKTTADMLGVELPMLLAAIAATPAIIGKTSIERIKMMDVKQELQKLRGSGQDEEGGADDET